MDRRLDAIGEPLSNRAREVRSRAVQVAPTQTIDGAEAQPTPEAAPPRRRTHFPCLDGYRALAALGVLVVHAALISGFLNRSPGWGQYLARLDIGVSIFFILSGFLIYRPFVAARFSSRPVMATGAFYKRRVLRILPAYWLALTVVGFIMRAPGFGHGHSIPLHYLLLHVYVLPMATGGPVQQSWSLSTEITFYAFLPLYVWLIGRRARPPESQLRVEISGALILIVGSVALKAVCLAAGMHADRYGQLGTWLPFRLDGFGLGMLLAVVSAWRSETDKGEVPLFNRWWAPWLSWALAGVTFWAICTQLGLPLAPTFTSGQAFAAQDLYLVAAVFFVLPGFFGPQRRGVIRGFLRNPVLAWLGVISYGIYIWHEGWLDLWFRWTGERYFTAPFWPLLIVNLLLTVAVAALSYYLVERWFLRLKDRPLLRRRSLAASTTTG